MAVDQDVLKKGRKAVEVQTRRLEQLKVEYVPVTAIEPNSYNPNRQSDRDFELLKRSMQEDGFTQPVLVHRDTKQIVDGEHRWRAAQDLGITEIPVVYVDMTPEQMRISTLRHNRARGSEDFELSASLLRDLRELGALDWAQDSLLLDDNEISRMLDDLPVTETLAGTEFSRAWEPDYERDETSGVTADAREFQGARSGVNESASVDAAARLAAAQALLASAKTVEEKREIARVRDIYRVSLTFSGEEAALVKSVLGSQPAVRVLAMCQAHAEAGEQPTTA